MALALYRKYRPRTFAEVIGQEHVTEPLSQALRSGRLNHAYLFSGPRGCGKTSSARILARSLNCEQGPTPDPCGVCLSCTSLANDGAGSIDVIEIDAASHGGVDDARELREKAFFAPANSRYKIYVIDEAHMVSSAGFNALLKLVEEPPEYVKFIFATTEPDKVLGTIRSRTHHYPFRLIPPAVLRPYLQQLTDAEGVAVEPSVFPLVVRAGGGSARDSLSILDQLIAGSGPDGVTYARAVGLLGVTDVTLIDDMCDAIATGDGAAAYATIDRVAEAGHEPRRFASDLLERFRDLIILQQVPDAVAKGLIDGPADQLETMAGQAAQLGAATLSRCADILHNGLVEMRGTTAPRLLLELVTARMLLPGADASAAALLQRLERLERSGVQGERPVTDHGSDTPPSVAGAVPVADSVSGPGGGAQGGASAGGGKAAAMAAAAAARAAATRPPGSARPVSPAPPSPQAPGPASPAPAGPASAAPPDPVGAPVSVAAVPSSPVTGAGPHLGADTPTPAEPTGPDRGNASEPEDLPGDAASRRDGSSVPGSSSGSGRPDRSQVADGGYPELLDGGLDGDLAGDYDEPPPWDDEPADERPARSQSRPAVRPEAATVPRADSEGEVRTTGRSPVGRRPDAGSGSDDLRDERSERVRAAWHTLGQQQPKVKAMQEYGIGIRDVTGDTVVFAAPTQALVDRFLNWREAIATEFRRSPGGDWRIRCEVGEAVPSRAAVRSGDGRDQPAGRRLPDGSERPAARPAAQAGTTVSAPERNTGRTESRPSRPQRPPTADADEDWPEPVRPGGSLSADSHAEWPEPARPVGQLNTAGAGAEVARSQQVRQSGPGSGPADGHEDSALPETARAGGAVASSTGADVEWPEPVQPGSAPTSPPAGGQKIGAADGWPEPARPGGGGPMTTIGVMGAAVGSGGTSVAPVSVAPVRAGGSSEGRSEGPVGGFGSGAADRGVAAGPSTASVTAGSPGVSVTAGSPGRGVVAGSPGGGVVAGSPGGGAASAAVRAAAAPVSPAVPARSAAMEAARAAARTGAEGASGAAAARAALANARGGGAVPAGGRAMPNRPAGGGAARSWSDAPPVEEAPYDPEYDGPATAYEGFDPGDEPLDEVIDEKIARQSSEEQAIQLLREAFGAEKIGEL